MQVKMLKTVGKFKKGDSVDVSEARAQYWDRVGAGSILGATAKEEKAPKKRTTKENKQANKRKTK